MFTAIFVTAINSISFFVTGEITAQYTNITEAEFDSIVAEWLRFAKQRKTRGEKIMENGNN